MPAPTTYEWTAQAIIDANTAALALIDAGSGDAYVAIRDNADVLLVSIDLDNPAGTVDGAGTLTLSPAGAGTAVADGTAAYAEICDSDNNVIVAMPAQAGASPVSGKVVINTLTVINGGTVTIVSATIS